MGPITEIFWIPIIAYSITKHRLFNTKVIAIELVTFALWIIILIRTFLAQNLHEVMIESALLLVTVIFGILLIRAVLHEISQREQIERLANDLKAAYANVRDLNDHLEQKVAEQTKEIRAAYEVEKTARIELERINETKDQFIMITQHHLRTPITSLRWQMEELLRGTYGKLTKKLSTAIAEADVSAKRLTHIINNFLSITAVKAGTDILTLKQTSLRPILEDALNELENEIRERNLTVEYPQEDGSWPVLPVDPEKMREVLLIILENAVRYNIKNGTVQIATKVVAGEKSLFEMHIENSGITISPEEAENIFSETFYRGTDAKTAHPMGMGIGLPVARAILKAHRGDIQIRPQKDGRGTEVLIQLPF